MLHGIIVPVIMVVFISNDVHVIVCRFYTKSMSDCKVQRDLDHFFLKGAKCKMSRRASLIFCVHTFFFVL